MQMNRGFVLKNGFTLTLVVVVFLLTPALAMAQQAEGISSWFTNIGGEVSSIMGVFVGIVGALGVGFVAVGVGSIIFAKKNRDPVSYQWYMVGGGIVLILLIPFILAMGTSASGEEQDRDTIEQHLD